MRSMGKPQHFANHPADTWSVHRAGDHGPHGFEGGIDVSFKRNEGIGECKKYRRRKRAVRSFGAGGIVYSTDVILDWLKSIRTAPDSRAVHLLVQRLDVVSDNEKTDFNVVSTLESVSEKLVRVVTTDSAANDHILFTIRQHRPFSGNAIPAILESSKPAYQPSQLIGIPHPLKIKNCSLCFHSNLPLGSEGGFVVYRISDSSNLLIITSDKQ